ncbi:MAG: TRAP transporter substrate-binding protein, partial [Chloroflexi bacterium]|nr:TRAP transporter substrate-binding protein [Chloroflexota bacterium]
MRHLTFALGTAAALAFGTGAATAETVTLRLSMWFPPKHQIVTGSLEPWIESVREASGGTLVIKPDPAPIAKPPGQYDVVKSGAADLAYHVAAYTPGPFEVMRGVELPFLSPNATVGSQAAFEWYDENIGFDEEFDEVKVVTLMVHGPGMIHSSRPVATLEDMAGLKLRVGGGGVRLSEALGATPVVMPGSQAYEAIQKGVAEGAMFPFEAISGYKLYELVDHHLEIPGGLYCRRGLKRAGFRRLAALLT